MKVFVEGGRICDISLGRITEDYGDDEKMNSIESMVTDELTTTKVTTELVEEGIGEAE